MDRAECAETVIDLQRQEIDKLRADLAAAREAALEEAAQVAETLPPATVIGYHDTHANNIAAAIRALKGDGDE